MSGPQCCQNPPNFSSGNEEEQGRVEEIGGFKSYTSGNPNSKLAVVLITDIFGYEAPKMRKLADKIAAAGFYVVVPDLLYGDPCDLESKDRPFLTWIKDHPTGKGCEDVRKVIAALKSNGVSAIGAAGFCWGGVVVSKLAKFDDIKAGVILHPGSISIDDINEIKAPTAILAAEIDHMSPPEQMKRLGEILSEKSVDNFVKIYPGVHHGWSVRYKDDNEHEVKSAMEAHSDMLNWFTKHIK